MSTLYLHIGTPKTATTSIQKFCMENQEILNKKGFSYPILDFKYPLVEIRRNGHFLVGRLSDADGQEDFDREEALWNKGLSMIHNDLEKFGNVILSDENIWHSSVGSKFDFWEKLRSDAEQNNYQIKVIVYLRRQDDFANSWLSQQIKEGWNTYAGVKWDTFMYQPRGVALDYYGLLEKIAEIIGRENIIVRIFERKRFLGNGGTIYSDFLDAVGLEYTDEFQVVTEETNPSLTANSQEIRRVINTILSDKDSTRSFLRKISEKCESVKSPDNVFEMLTEEESDRFMKKYAEGNAAIAREYLGLESDELFSHKTRASVRWTPQNDFMHEDIIRFFGMIAVVQKEEIDDLKVQLKREKENKEKSLEVFMKDMADTEIADSKEIIKGISRVGEQILEYKKEMKDIRDESNKSRILRDKVKSMNAQILSLKNDIFVLRRANDELKRANDVLKKNNEELKNTIERVVYKIKHPLSIIKDKFKK